MATTTVDNVQQGTLGKYRGLLISLIILVVLVISLLLLNLYFSQSLEKSTQISAASNRQTALVQQISKELFLISSQYQKVLPYDEEKANLEKAINTFDNTLNAFALGGVLRTIDTNGVESEEIKVDKLVGDKFSNIMSEAKTIWSQYLEKSKPVLETEDASQMQLFDARDFADENSSRLSELMEELSEEIQVNNDKNILYLRIAQVVGIILTALMFLYTIFVTGRNLRKNDEEIEQARQETQGILNTVKEGLFLLDSGLVISSQHSKEMLEIFEVDSISGREFSGLLGDILDSSELSTVEEFVKLLFDDHVIEELIGSLNPLDKVEVTFNKSDDTIQKKYLSFDFFRVVRNEKIQEVLVSVSDITSRVLLEMELESTKEQGEQQVEMLVSFLQADPDMLRSFLLDSRESLVEVNAILKDPVMDKVDLKAKIDKMFISVHRMKGEAAAMKFDAFAEKAHEFETGLSDLKRVTNIKGIDFLPLTIQLDKLISYNDTLNELSNRLQGSFDDNPLTGETSILTDSSNLDKQKSAWSQLNSIVETVAKDTGKQVHLVVSGLIENQLNKEQKKIIKDVSIQLLRNSVVHGIETPDERLKLSKSAFGRIDVRLAALADGMLELTVRDDGQGLNINLIKERILSKGIVTEDELKKWTDQKIVSMAFSSGFSTVETTGMHAGRGVGLDIIRDSIKSIGGQLRLRQCAGKYCQFEVVLPAMG